MSGQQIRLFWIVLGMLVLAACGISGSGNLVTESRQVGEFDSLDVSAGIDVILTVDRDADPQVSVTYDDNVIDDVVTRVRGDTLVIEFRSNFTFIGTLDGDRVVEVTVPSLDEIEMSGGSSVTGSGEVDSYRLRASGGSNADLRSLEADEIDLDASGGADVEVFASESVEGDASGGSDVTVYGDPDRVLINTSGGAEVDVR